MKKTVLLLLLLFSTSLFSQIRKSLNDLSPSTRTELVDLMKEYITRDVIENHCSSLSDGHTMDIHNDDNFLPFHRCYIEAMEDFLIKKGHPEFVPLPAWPPNTPVPTEFRVVDPDCPSAVCDIGVGSSSSTNCSSSINWNPAISRPSYLTLPIKTGSDNDLCDFSIPGNSNGSITRILEGQSPNTAGSTYHNSVHSKMGGAMGYFTSPALPIFWCFHAYVDDIWKEYQCSCPNKGGKALDLYMKDTPRVTAVTRDAGAEPNADPGVMNASTDIWVRNQNDGKVNFVHQNPIFSTLNYIYVRVRNRGCQTSSGTEQLVLHWSKGATDQTWPSYWNGSIKTPVVMGDTVTVVTIPAMAAGTSTILEIQWFPPNSANYSSNVTPKLFSLLARIVSPNDPMATIEGSNVSTNARNNNNIVMKNITIDSPPNVLPLVSITAPAAGSQFIAPATILLKANASDNDGSISKVEFYNGSTLLGTSTSSPYTYNWSNVPVGSYTITAKAMDDLNASTVSTAVTFTVKSNTSPVVTISSPVDGSMYIGPASIALTANASDADGGISKVEFYNGTVLLGTVTNSPYTFNWNSVAVGAYTLTARAYDDLNASTTSIPVNITVNNNNLPVVTITDPLNGTTLIAPATITIKANASDSDGNIAKVEFYNGTVLLGTSTSSPYAYTFGAIPAGVYTLTAKAVDDLNAVSTSTLVTLTVNNNSAPTVSLTSPSDGTVLIAPVSTTIKVTASDADGSISKVEFYNGTTLLGEDISAPYTFDWSNIAAGTYNLTAKAVDDLNAITTSAAVTLVVNNNNAPTIAITAPLDGAPFIAPASLTIKANATDSDGNISKVEFYDGVTLLGEDVSSPYTFDWNILSLGSHTLTAKAYDDLNAVTTSTAVTVTVTNNNLPTIAITAPLDGSALVAPATITIKANTTDSDGSISKVEFYNGTSLLGTVTNSPYTFNWTSIPTGTYTLTAKAVDDLNAVNTSTAITIHVKDNSLPTVNITAPVNGTIAFAPANIAIKANASDSDGNITKVEFYEGTTLLGTSTTSPYSYNWNTVLSGTYTLTAKAYDDLNAVKTSAAVTITVKNNTPPTVAIISPGNGATATAPATMTIKATATDSDGSISKVEFLRGTTLLGEDLTSPYTFDWNNVPAGTYTLSVKAVDDLGDVAISNEITVTVKPNSLPTVSIEEPFNGSTAIAPANFIIKVNASDSDGHISKVEFYNGSTLLGEDVSAPYTFDWKPVPTGVYTLTAKAYDNVNATTTSAGISVTVNPNTPPVVQITEPSNGVSFISPAAFTIKATATDNDGSIGKVEFYNGTVLLGSDNTSPYSFDWNNIGAGNYKLTAKAYDNLNTVTTSSEVAVTVTGNSHPVVEITYPSNNELFISPTIITIEANASDSDGSISKVEFYDGSNLLGTAVSSPYTIDWTTIPKGTHYLTVKAVDNINATTTSAEVKIIVQDNNFPMVSITSPTDGMVLLSSTKVTIEADASDSDGTVSRIEFYNGNTLLGTANSSPFSYEWNNVPVGNYKILAKAYDNLDAFSFSDTVKFSVVSNNAPAVTITEPTSGTPFVAPATIIIKANATDSDGSISKVEFYDGTTLLGEDLTTPYTFNWNSIPVGTYTLTAKAYDNFHVVTVSTAITVTVKNNTAPVVSIAEPVDGTIGIAPAHFTIKANATDSDGSISKVEFYNGSILLGEDLINPYTFDWSAIPAGTYSLTAKAYDDLNVATISGAVTVTVHDNEAPVVTLTAPLNGTTAIAPAQVTIKANATDNDGNISKVEFYNGTSLLATSTTSPYKFDWNAIPTGIYSLTAKAYDDLNGITTSAAITLTVKDNSLPTVAIVAPLNGTTGIAPVNFIIKVNAADSDGSISRVEFYDGTTLLGTDVSSPYTYDWNSVSAGIYTLTAKAVDDLNAVETSAAVTVTIKDNVLPTIAIVSPLNSTTAIAPASITIKANANDSDGNISKVEFYEGATLLATEITSPYTFTWNAIPKGVYTLTAKAYDDLNAVETSTAVTLTVNDNALPTVAIISPLTGVAEIAPASFIIKVHATDMDGSISKVEFYNGSTLLGTDASTPYTFDWDMVAAGMYTLTAKAYDDLNGVTSSSEVKIVVKDNALPTVAIAAPVNGTSLIAPASFIIKANASDNDGSISKVEFYEGNTLLGTDVSSPYTYDWNSVPAGIYTLTAKAVDDLNAVVTSAEVKVTINNNIPPAIALIAPANGANVIASALVTLKANATDNDGSISKVEFYNGTTLLGTATTNPYVYDWSNIPPGVHTLTAKAYDNLNAFAVSSEVKLTVNNNNFPIVNITAPVSNVTLLAPASITIKANASDSDGSISKVEFYNGTTLLGTDVSSPYLFDWTPVPAGNYILTVKAVDDLNAVTASDNVTIRVLDNTLPVVSITSPATDAMYMPPAAIDITAAASDANGSISKVEFYAGSTLIGTVNTSPYTFHWTNVALGDYRLTAKAVDNLNASAISDTVKIRVAENTKPMVIITKPYEDDYFNLPVDVIILAHAQDMDGMVTKVEFYQNNILLSTDFTSPYEFEWKNVPAGKYDLVAVAYDDMGDTANSSVVKITVDSNILPIVEITSPVSGDAFSAPSDILITAEASDITGSVQQVDFYYNGIFIESDTSSPYSVLWKNVPEGSYRLVAEVHDNQNGVNYSDDVLITVINNPAPTVTITSPMNGDNYISGADIDITATAQDDGNIQRVDFYKGDVLVASDSSAPYSCDWKNAAQGHYALTAKAYDNLGIVAVSQKVNITVKDNTLPTVMLVSPVNNAIYTAPTDIFLEADAQDMDGTIAYVNFYEGTNFIGSDSTKPYTFSWQNVAVGTYAVIAKAVDDLKASSESSISTITVVSNQLPVITITSPKDGDTFTAPANITIEAHAQDINGSIVRVDFYRGNALIGSDSTHPYSYAWKDVGEGSYIITAKAFDNLSATNTSAEIKIIVKDIPTSIDQPTDELKDILLYPVPFDSKITLTFTSLLSGRVNIRMYNETGKEIFALSKTISQGNQVIDIDTQHLPSGLYFLTLQTGKQLLKKKLLKIDSN